MDHAGESHRHSRSRSFERISVCVPERRSGDKVGSRHTLDDLHARSRNVPRAHLPDADQLNSFYHGAVATIRPIQQAIPICRHGLSWTTGKHYLRFGASIIHHQSGGTGNEPGALTLGTFTFFANTPSNTRPLGQLTLADVQNYQQPINFGFRSYDLGQWLLTSFVQDKWRVSPDLTLDLGLRYDRQTLTDARSNFQPRLGFAWNPSGDSRTVIRGGYGMYYTQIRTNAVAGYLINGLDGIATYTATPGQTGFPTCLDRLLPAGERRSAYSSAKPVAGSRYYDRRGQTKLSMKSSSLGLGLISMRSRATIPTNS